jgi:2-oxo-4-hydroxy-4-carboxy--5-ureidoimidazoline (OHCU) decarboxylase
MAKGLAMDESAVKGMIKKFDKQDILDAASFHGDIGEQKGLDKLAAEEQSLVRSNQAELIELGDKYRLKFGMKFLISAAGKSGSQLLSSLKERLHNSEEQEIEHAKEALLEITLKRMHQHPVNSLFSDIEKARA